MGKPVQFKIKSDTNMGSQKKFKIGEDSRDIIDGIIVDSDNNPIENAIVKLYIINSETNNLDSISYSFTDEYGEFVFGPVDANNNYLIKVWYDINEDSPIQIKAEPVRDLSSLLNETNLETAEFCHVEYESADNIPG